MFDSNQPSNGSSRAVSDSRPMTPEEAADFLGLDVKTITRWARASYIPAHPLGQGKRKFWRLFKSELLAWLGAQNNGAVAG